MPRMLYSLRIPIISPFNRRWLIRNAIWSDCCVTIQGVLDLNSTTVHTVSYYPDSYFNCTYNTLQGSTVFLQYKVRHCSALFLIPANCAIINRIYSGYLMFLIFLLFVPLPYFLALIPTFVQLFITFYEKVITNQSMILQSTTSKSDIECTSTVFEK